MAPARVAELALQGIRDEQFYIFTDREWDHLLTERFENVLQRRNPEPSPS